MSKLSTYLQKKQDLKNKKETNKTVSLIRMTIPLYENKTLDGKKSCAVILPVMSDNIPNVLKFSKLWNVS